MVTAIFADVKSAFTLVHHPRMLQTLKTQGFLPDLVSLIRSSITKRETYLSFNGYDSSSLPLNHGLPQGFPLSPLLYLLYNHNLLALANTHVNSSSLGFVDDFVLLTAAPNQQELGRQVQALANY